MPPYGGFWRRVFAYFLDSLILTIVGGIIAGALFGSAAGLVALVEDRERNPLLAGTFMTAQAASLLLNWLYFAGLESSSLQGTLGKKAMGMIVTDLDGRRISFARATGRYFAKYLSALILLLGFVMVAFSSRKQGLHDKLAGTLVYRADSSRALDTSADVFA